MKRRLFSVLCVLCLLVPFFSAVPASAQTGGSVVYVDATWTGPENCGGHEWGVDAFATIHDALAALSPAEGGTIYVAAGCYTEGAIDLTGWSNLTIAGAGRDVATFTPSATVGWNVGPYGAERQAAIRAVSCQNLWVGGLTFDFGLVKGNYVTGLLLYDSEGAFADNTFENMSVDDAAGGYYEVTVDARAPGFTDADRAEVFFENDRFIDTGRLGIRLGDYIYAGITSCWFEKIFDDFGYAVEAGSESTATITDCDVLGYHTPAASDGSAAGGLYVENCFTPDITTPLEKDVEISHCFIRDCQWGIYVGNEFAGYAGNVTIALNAHDNTICDNTVGGVGLADEDASAGSAVDANFSGNTVSENGDYGYYIYTPGGNGHITATISEDIISGNDAGVYLEDSVDLAGGTTTSFYDVALSDCYLSGNTTAAVLNTYDGTVISATDCWWGGAGGPAHTLNTYELGEQGGAVSDYVTFLPFLTSGEDRDDGSPGFQPAPGTSLVPVTSTSPPGSYSSIQAAVSASDAGGTVNAATGTFTEQVLINKNLTLAGTGETVVEPPSSPVSYKFSESAASWAPVIFAYGGTMGEDLKVTGTETVSVSVSGLVVDGCDLTPADRSVGILFRNADGSISDNVVRNMGVGAQQTFGIMAYGDSDVTISGNEVTGFSRGAIGANGDDGPLPDPTAVIEDNTVTGPGREAAVTWAPNGIQIGWGATGRITSNEVRDCGVLNPDWTGSGIVVMRADGVLVEDNDVISNQTGISVGGWTGSGSANGTIVRGNTVTQNLCGVSIQAYSVDATVENNIITANVYDGVDVWGTSSSDAPTGTAIHHNIIAGNNTSASEGCGGMWVGPEVAEVESVDATGNWWGDASGPHHDGDDPTGGGDWIYGDVTHDPFETGNLAWSPETPTAALPGDKIDLICLLTWSDGTALKAPGEVAFSATLGSVETPAALADGQAETSWKTGAELGPATLTASFAGLTASTDVSVGALAPPRSLKGKTAPEGVSLSWTMAKGMPTPDGFEVYIRIDRTYEYICDITEWSTEGSVLSAVVTPEDYPALNTGERFYFKLTAYTEVEPGVRTRSAQSNVASAVAGPVLPAAPIRVSARPAGVDETGFTLRWTPRGTPDGYHVLVGLSSAGSFPLELELDGAATSCVVTREDITGAGLEFVPGGRYYARIYSYVLHPVTLEEVWSRIPGRATATSGPPLPNAPTSLRVTADPTGAALSWNSSRVTASAPAPDTYLVYIATTPRSSFTLVKEVPAAAGLAAPAPPARLTCVVTAGDCLDHGFTLEPETRYYFKVFASYEHEGGFTVVSRGAASASGRTGSWAVF